MAEKELIEKCRKAAKQIRRDILDMTYATGNTGAHLGGSLSMAEMLAALYVGIINYNPQKPDWPERDKVILSKGHAALALYPAMVQADIISREELATFKQDGGKLGGHPSLNGLPGIEFASGSLGQGLSLGVGTCLALQRQKNTTSRVFVFMGDGECDEGSVWEAAASAAHFNLKQLVAIVDENNIQYDGYTKDILSMSLTEKKWQAFGWEVHKIDGHNIEALLDAYNVKGDKPIVILAQTTKGKGVSFMEDNWKYHNSKISKEQYEQAITEVENAI